MNSKQARKARRQFLRDSGPLVVLARLNGMSQEIIDFWIYSRRPAPISKEMIERYRNG